MSVGSHGRRRLSPRAWLLTVAVFALLFWAVIYPNLIVLGESLGGDAGLTLRHYSDFFRTPAELRALWSSFWISVATVFLSALIGIPLAFLFTRFEFPGRRVLGALAAMPVLLPPLVGVIAILFLYGESGIATRLIQSALGLESPPWRLQGAGGILAVHAYSMYVYFYLFTLAGLARLDPAVHEAAASLGAGPWSIWMGHSPTPMTMGESSKQWRHWAFQYSSAAECEGWTMSPRRWNAARQRLCWERSLCSSPIW